MVTTNFTVNGTEVGDYYQWMDKEYLIENYPDISNTFKQAGLWSWGINTSGQLGNNSITDKSSPVQTVASGTNWKQVACGYAHTAAIKTDGILWLWGSNSDGQLGNNSITDKSSPVQTVSGGTNWKQVACGDYHTAAVKTDGTLWMWGYNAYGQLGNNSSVSRSSPVQTVSGGTNWKQVSVGYGHTAAIKTDGTLWLWGRSDLGALGNNSITNKSSPIQTVSGGTNWKQVACYYSNTAAIKTDGTLWLWGYNAYGQLGNNTNGNGGATNSKSSPIQTVSGGTNWKLVAGGTSFTAATKTDGTLWMWGYNLYGQLGDNSITDKSSPVQTVSGGTNWKQLSGAPYHAAAIKTDGTLWVWGYNFYGGLGDNSTTNKSSPVQTVNGGTNWKSVSCEGYHTVSVRDDSLDQI